MRDLLVVEDELSVREFIRATLKRAQIPFRMAAGGTQALALARANWPGAVLLDLTLPGRLDGWQVWEALSEIAAGRSFSVVLFTADDLEIAERTRVERDAFGVLRKPVSSAQLVAVAKQALEKSE
jgi:two-component system, OmpR family, alkaline phosphatase synthesis response regulator PhoP